MPRKGYNPIYRLHRIAEIQQVVRIYARRGSSLKWIYHNLIKDRYFISMSTFSRYLGVRVKKELRELEKSRASEKPP